MRTGHSDPQRYLGQPFVFCVSLGDGFKRLVRDLTRNCIDWLESDLPVAAAKHQTGGCSMADHAAGSQSQPHRHCGIASTTDGSAAGLRADDVRYDATGFRRRCSCRISA